MPPTRFTGPKPTFFKNSDAFRKWLQRHHATQAALWVGYYKKSSGKGGLVYPEALDQALCFGWIDGLVKSIDEDCYMQRWTPRRKGSYWSAVNIRKMQRLIEAGLVAPAGLARFEARSNAPPGKYSNENKDASFDAATLRQFRANRQAWRWFEAQSSSFKRVAVHWITSAKKPETRATRLATLIAAAERGEKPRGFVLAPAPKADRKPATTT